MITINRGCKLNGVSKEKKVLTLLTQFFYERKI